MFLCFISAEDFRAELSGIYELLLLRKSVLSTSPKTQNEKVMEYSLKIEWPDDYILKEKVIILK